MNCFFLILSTIRKNLISIAFDRFALIVPCAKDIAVAVVHSGIGDVTQTDIERLSSIKEAETCVLGTSNTVYVCLYVPLFVFQSVYMSLCLSVVLLTVNIYDVCMYVWCMFV